MKVVAFLPAKSHSERINNKNVELLDGRPLFLHNLEKLCALDCIDQVYLDTESEEIFSLADHLPIEWMKRDPKLATNATDGHELFMNEVRHVEADIYVQLLATSPFIKPETITRAVEIVKNDPNHDSVVTIFKETSYTWANGQPSYGIGRIPNSFDLSPTIKETMALYVVSRQAALKTGRRFGEKPYLLPISVMEATDVNSADDFEFAERIAAGTREADRVQLRSLRHLISSANVSDALDDFGINSVILGLKSNLPHAKLIGRANTLQLRRMDSSDDYRGIYDALESYKTIVPNDVICVDNGAPENAYFGELNANLAIRRGAAGMITNGATRDARQVAAADFVTFSKGNVARDVKRRAIVASRGKPITLFDTVIHAGDLIVADQDGVCVIPKLHEKQVIAAVLEKLRTESQILLEIAEGRSEAELFQKNGEF
jgi:regulator of RNase E activity RraA/CMP-N-acetylneuraminic acid synthetase